MVHDRGFTIVEVLIALMLIAIAASGVAGLCAIAIRDARDARDETLATLLAGQKIEQLQAASALSADVAFSPPGALTTNLPGYVEFLDPHGRSVGAGASPPPEATFVRRWSIEPSGGVSGARTLRVLVTPVARAEGDGGAAPRRRYLREALVVARRSEW